jgi:hypothetical protein
MTKSSAQELKKIRSEFLYTSLNCLITNVGSLFDSLKKESENR